MRHVITGGAGFIGSHLADALVARGEEVVVLDNLSTGRLDNIAQLVEEGTVEFVEGTALDEALVDRVLRGADRCYHLASAVGVKLIVDQPLRSMLDNVGGMQTVISTAARHDVRLLVASTSEIYGKSSQALSEDADRVLGAPTKARWTYANAKVHGEMLAYGYGTEYGAESMVARFFNTVGPRQQGMYGMVVPRFVEQALGGEQITVYGDGTQSRCFTHVRDAVSGILSIIECDEAVGLPFNIGSPVEVKINELAGIIKRMTGSEAEIRHVPYEEAYGSGFEELGRRRPDTSRLEALTGWRIRCTVEQAIDEIIAATRTAPTLLGA